MTKVPRLPSPSLCGTFETESKNIWVDLEYALQMGLIRDEETITNDLLLNVQRAHPFEVIVIQSNKPEEGEIGADWELWLTNGTKWVGLLVQAKKLNPKTNRYEKIKYKDQMGSLIRWAGSKGIAPLYFFYNYSSSSSHRFTWNCFSTSFIKAQLGCTVAPAVAVKTVVNSGGTGFSKLSRISLPMKCLVCCPGFADPDTSLPGRVNGVANGLASVMDGGQTDTDAFDPSQLREEPPGYVRRLLAAPEEERGALIEQFREEIGPIGGLVVIKEPVDR